MLCIVGVKSSRIAFKIEFFLNWIKQLDLFGEAGKISLLVKRLLEKLQLFGIAKNEVKVALRIFFIEID